MKPLAAHLPQITDRPTGTIEEEPSEPACPMCNGAGYLRWDVPLGHEKFGELETCECFKRELRERQLAQLIQESRIGKRREITFERYLSSAPEPHAWKQGKVYADKPEGWLFINGPVGTSKTYLACAILNTTLDKGWQSIFTVVPDLLDHLRATFSPSSEVRYDDLFNAVRESDLLVLDDYGSNRSTEWATEKLFQICNHRWLEGLPTILTTNLSETHLDDRMNSRMRDSKSIKVGHV